MPAWWRGRREDASWAAATSGGPGPAHWAASRTLTQFPATAKLSHPHFQPLTSSPQGLLGSLSGAPSRKTGKRGTRFPSVHKGSGWKVAGGQGAASSVPERHQTHLLVLFTLGVPRSRPLAPSSCWPGTGHSPHCLKIGSMTLPKLAPAKSHPLGSIGPSAPGTHPSPSTATTDQQTTRISPSPSHFCKRLNEEALTLTLDCSWAIK